MSAPTLWHRIRHTAGRVVRDMGQTWDRHCILIQIICDLPDHRDVYPKFVREPTPIYADHLSRHRQQFPLLYSGKPQISDGTAFVAPCCTMTGSVHVGPGVSIWYGAVLRADSCINAVPPPDLKLDVPIGDNREVLLPSGSSDNKALPSGDSNSSSNNESTDNFAISVNNDENLPSTTGSTISTCHTTGVPWIHASSYAEVTDADAKPKPIRHGGGIFIGRDTNVQDGCIITARENHTIIGQGVTIGHLAQIHSATVHDFSLIGMGSVIEPNVVIETESLIGAGAVVKANTVIKAGELWIGCPARKVRDMTSEQRQLLHYQSEEYVKVGKNQKGVEKLGGNFSAKDIEAYFLALVKEEQRLHDMNTAEDINSDDDSNLEATQEELAAVEEDGGNDSSKNGTIEWSKDDSTTITDEQPEQRKQSFQ